jgi:hypothetical protein
VIAYFVRGSFIRYFRREHFARPMPRSPQETTARQIPHRAEYETSQKSESFIEAAFANWYSHAIAAARRRLQWAF